MGQWTEATAGIWVLVLVVLASRCQIGNAGSGAGTTGWPRRVLDPVCKGNSRFNRDGDARSLVGLRGGSTDHIGVHRSSAVQGAWEAGGRLRGGDAHAGADVSFDGENGNGSVDETNWLNSNESDVVPKTAPAFQLALRGCFLILVFLFPLLSAGVAYLSSWFREKVWYGALTYSIGLSGTAFIKWGQWSSTRPDMFPEGLCDSLSVLHKGAPSHNLRHTKKLVERAYGGRSISEVFEWFEPKPIASGSIAQVHKAVYQGQVVAVKVRHPKVKERMFLDFLLMKKIATFADHSPSLKWLNLGPSMEQFSNTMSAQTDLLLEAHHLDAFNANFETWSDCAFPRVVHCVEDVLVETFEEGIVVAEYTKLFANKAVGEKLGLWEWARTKLLGMPTRHPKNGLELDRPDPFLGHFIVTRGEDMWLKMVLDDGLLHADLHPGNILVHVPKDEASPPRLVLVDAGMVAYLRGHQRRHFIRLLECLGSGDGVAAARTVLQFSTKQTCVGEAEQASFLVEMDSVFKDRCKGYHTDVDVGNILRGVLTCVRRHSVRVDVEYATLILNILCLDGMGKALLPTYNILDGAQSLLEANRVGRRLVGGLGVKTILPLARAFKSRQDRKFLRKLKRETASRDQTTARNAAEHSSTDASQLPYNDSSSSSSSSRRAKSGGDQAASDVEDFGDEVEEDGVDDRGAGATAEPASAAGAPDAGRCTPDAATSRGSDTPKEER